MEFNLRGIDLNLLPVFEAAYEERSLSRAAQRLAMTQPAMSHALSRLRHVFKDELFVRHSRGMTPTTAAGAIYARLRGALDSVRDVVNAASDFDPAISLRRFFISIPHPLGPTIALKLIERLSTVAPHFIVEFSTRSRPVDLEKDLRDGKVDVAIDWQPTAEPQFRSSVLFEDRIVAMARAGQPAFSKKLSVKSLQEAQFVSLRPRETHERHHLAATKQWRNLKINAVLEVSELLEILLVVSQTDFFGLMASSMAGVAEKTFQVRPLEIQGFKPELLPICMIWNPRRENDSAHKFLRQQVRIVMSEILA